MSGSRRRQPLPDGWESQIRPAVLKRDGYACQWPVRGGICGARANQVDHADPDGSQVDMSNLWSLCTPHHNHKTGKEAGRASAAQRRAIAAKRFRKPGPHPGLITKEAS